ncbi:MAG: nucleotidyltransferase family protein [Prosthecobacter sp.]
MNSALVSPVAQRLRSLLPALRQQFPIRRMALCGSVARGDGGPESDIDILVEVDPSIGLGFVTLAERLEAELGRKVDLVSRRAMKPAMYASIEPDLIHVEA